MDSSDREQPTFLSISASSIGFILVAFLTALAGNALSRSSFSLQTIPYNDLVLITAYVVLLSPYYISRQALLERKLPNRKLDNYAVTVGFQVPVVLFFLLTFVAFLVLPRYYAPPTLFAWGRWQDVVILIFIGLAPFILLLQTSIHDLKQRDSYRAIRFAEKVLLPAVATGVVPFSLGWSISGNPISLMGIVVGALYVCILVVVPRLLRVQPFWATLGLFMLTLVMFVVSRMPVLSVIVYGTIITLAMGVSEVSKRVPQAAQQDRSFPKDQGLDYYLAGANWASIIFPLALSLVPLFIDELPAWPVLMLIAIQSLTWLLIDDKHKVTRLAAILGLVFGYGLPILIILIRMFSVPITILQTDSIGLALAPFGVMLAIGTFLTNIYGLGPEIRAFFDEATQYETYLTKRNCYYLFVASLVAYITLVALVAQIFGPVAKIKATESIIFATVLLFIVGGSFIATQLRGRPTKNPKQTTVNGGTRGTNHGKSDFGLVLKTSRPITATVAGLAAFLILRSNNTYSLWWSLIHSIPFVLVTMAGFIVNDVYDYEKDSRANVERPIAMGQLDRIRALYYALAIAAVAIGLSLFTPSYLGRAALLTTLVAVLLYSPLSRHVPIIKGAITAGLCLAPVIYASYLTTLQVPLFVYSSIAIFILGRELLLDTKDVERDLASGIKTIVAYLGTNLSRFVAWLLMFLGSVYFLLNLTSQYAIAVASLGLCCLGIAFALDRQNQVKDGGITIISMILFLFAIPLIL